jgi:hypothetical protein
MTSRYDISYNESINTLKVMILLVSDLIYRVIQLDWSRFIIVLLVSELIYRVIQLNLSRFIIILLVAELIYRMIQFDW